MAASEQPFIHRQAFPLRPELKYALTYTPSPHGLLNNYPKAPCPPLMGTVSHGGVDRWALTVPRAPLPEGRCDRLSARDCNPCRRALPQLSRSYGLMRRTSILSRPRFYPCTLSLCRLLRAPAGRRPFPALSPRIFLQAPGPLPRRSPWCIDSFLPMGHRPSPFPKQVGMPQKSRATTSARRLFSGLQSFTHVQAPGFARHPGRSHRRSGPLDPHPGQP